MNRYSDDDLILFRYGESPDAEAVRDALATDPELARRYAELERALATFDSIPAAEPPAGFEAELWRSLRPRLKSAASRRRTFGLSWPRGLTVDWRVDWRLVATAGAALALAAGGFFAGRFSDRSPSPVVLEARAADSVAAPLPAPARERVLLASVAGHLAASERLLADLVNRSAEVGSDAEERTLARALLDSNRLYRLAAERSGQRRIVALLDQLEPVLLDLARSPDDTAEPGAARRRAEENDLLFKVRIVGGRLSGQSAGRPPTPTTTL